MASWLPTSNGGRELLAPSESLAAVESPDARHSSRRESKNGFSRGCHVALEGSVRPLTGSQPRHGRGSVPVVPVVRHPRLALGVLPECLEDQGTRAEVAEAPVPALLLTQTDRGLPHEVMEVPVTVILDDALERHYHHGHCVWREARGHETDVGRTGVVARLPTEPSKYAPTL